MRDLVAKKSKSRGLTGSYQKKFFTVASPTTSFIIALFSDLSKALRLFSEGGETCLN